MADGRKPEELSEDFFSEEEKIGRRAVSSGGQPQYKDPLSLQIAQWCQTAEKTTKAIRVYDHNNQTLIKFIDRAEEQLKNIHREVEEFTLNIREDKFLHREDLVYENADRQQGLPFLLYRNAIRRISLSRGFTRQELVQFFSALTTDFNTFDYAGEDLVTILWRLQLAHLNYFAVEALSIASSNSAEIEQNELRDVEDIQNDVDSLVAAIYASAADEEDLVESITITKEDLEALKEIRDESDDDLELFDKATSRALTKIPAEAVQAIHKEREVETHEKLMSRLVNILIDVLFAEKGSKSFAANMDIIQQLMDAILFAGHYDQAILIVENLKKKADRSENLAAMHVSRHIQNSLSAPAAITPLISIMDQELDFKAMEGVTRYLQCLGPHVSGTLITLLDKLNSRETRKKIVELIESHPLNDISVVLSEMEKAKPVVMINFLEIGQNFTHSELGRLILVAMEQDYPPLRIKALGLLRNFAKGTADELITSSFSHAEIEIRIKAYQMAAARKSVAARSTLRLTLLSEDVWTMNLREVRTITAAFAEIADADAVMVLGKILNPGLFSKKKVDTQVAAAFALAQINNDAALQLLKKGTKGLSSKVKDACKRAMADGAGAANIATFLGQELVTSGSAKLSEARGDVLKKALDERRRKKNLATDERESMQLEPEDTRTEEELFANVLKPHNEPDFVPGRLMSVPTAQADPPAREKDFESALAPKTNENSQAVSARSPAPGVKIATEELATKKSPAIVTESAALPSSHSSAMAPNPQAPKQELPKLDSAEAVRSKPTSTPASAPPPPAVKEPHQTPAESRPIPPGAAYPNPSLVSPVPQPATPSRPMTPHPSVPHHEDRFFPSQRPAQNSVPHSNRPLPPASHPQFPPPSPQLAQPPVSPRPHPSPPPSHHTSPPLMPNVGGMRPHPSPPGVPHAPLPHAPQHAPPGRVVYPPYSQAPNEGPMGHAGLPPKGRDLEPGLPTGREPPKRNLSADFRKKTKVKDDQTPARRSSEFAGREYEKKGGDS